MIDPLSGRELTQIKRSLHFERKEHMLCTLHTRAYPAWISRGQGVKVGLALRPELVSTIAHARLRPMVPPLLRRPLERPGATCSREGLSQRVTSSDRVTRARPTAATSPREPRAEIGVTFAADDRAMRTTARIVALPGASASTAVRLPELGAASSAQAPSHLPRAPDTWVHRAPTARARWTAWLTANPLDAARARTAPAKCALPNPTRARCCTSSGRGVTEDRLWRQRVMACRGSAHAATRQAQAAAETAWSREWRSGG